MFVSESALFMGTKLQVLSVEGQVWEAQLEQGLTIQQLKQMAFDKFYASTSAGKNGGNPLLEQFRGRYLTMKSIHLYESILRGFLTKLCKHLRIKLQIRI
jgi:hypothetical protein